MVHNIFSRKGICRQVERTVAGTLEEEERGEGVSGEW
jgi:hypothetical protein